MKRFSKFLLFILVLSMMVMFSVGCSQPSNEEEVVAEEYLIKLSTSEALDPNISIEAVEALKFQEYIESKSNGQIKVEIFPGGALGDAESCLEQVKNGVITAAASADAKLATLYAPIQVFSIPYLFETREDAYKMFDESQIVKDLNNDMVEKTELRIIMFGENGGFRSFSNDKLEIRTPNDMKGLKIRTMSSPLHMDIVKNLGGVPTPIAWSELYTGLQTGVVDGQENAPATVKMGHLEEVQKYYTLDNHVYSMTAFVINDKWLQSLPEELKAIVLEGGVVAANAGRQACIDNEADILKYLEENGMQIYSPTTEEFAMFREATQKPAMEWLKQNVEDKWIDGVVSAAE